jgi:alpha-ketoglutarate-dependent taurine dioxygenase
MLDVRPVTPVIGAEVRGIDLSQPLASDIVDALRAAWLEHLVLFFVDQELTPEQQLAFAAQFGEVTAAHPIEPALEDHPQVLPIDSVKDRTDFWHTDVTFMSRPPMGSILYARVLPETGGDTMFANTRAAYERLAAPLREFCDGLVAYHYAADYAQQVAEGEGKAWDGKPVKKLVPVRHPVVREHPETGRRNLFVNPNFTVALEGFDGPQGHALLQLLYDEMTRPELTCRHRWRPGSVAMWDNRTTMHYGIYDYGDARRLMHRVTLRGDKPYGPALPLEVGPAARAD